ncbi:MAG: DUF58 domain-containing protein, partial [Armatimonadota bacterium]
LSRGTLGALSVRREAPGLMKEGQQRRVRLTVTNEGLTRRYFLTVGDRLPEGLEAVGEGGGRALVPSIAADEQFVAQYVLRARRRGVYQLGPASLEHADLIGLFRFRREVGHVDELVVHPTPERLPGVWRRVASLRAPQRPRRRFRGDGTEFYGTRPFVPGDDLRRVDWKSTARRGHLIVREYERPEATDAVIVLDLERAVHHGEGDDSTLERGVKLAASLAAEMLEHGSSVGMVAAGASDYSLPPSADPRQRVRIFDALARVQADGRVALGEVIATHQQYLRPGVMVLVISPRLGPDAIETAVGLVERGHAVGWMVVEAPGPVTLRREEANPDQLAARLGDRGVVAWTVQAGRELAASLRRAPRAS